jgi:hypothetical protein
MRQARHIANGFAVMAQWSCSGIVWNNDTVAPHPS